MRKIWRGWATKVPGNDEEAFTCAARITIAETVADMIEAGCNGSEIAAILAAATSDGLSHCRGRHPSQLRQDVTDRFYGQIARDIRRNLASMANQLVGKEWPDPAELAQAVPPRLTARGQDVEAAGI